MRFPVKLVKQAPTIFLWLIILAVNISDALANEADVLFQQGVVASRRGDNEAAVRAFEAAKQAGMTSAALYYNLGVMYYRMKVYSWSEEYFGKLTDDQTYSALAYYNLGLIAASRDNIELAIQHFQTCRSLTEDEKLKQLSARALKRLKGGGSSRAVTANREDPPPWRGIVLLSVARDDNVGLDNDEVKNVTGVSEISDTYYEVLATTHGFLGGNRRGGFSLSGYVYAQKYSTAAISAAYDYNQLHLAFNRETKAHYWQVAYGLGADQTTFGGANFQKLYSAFLRAKRYLDHKKYIRLRLMSYKIDSNPLYQYLDGYKHQLKFDFTVPGAGWRYRVVYMAELNNREDYQTATTFHSYSPLRNTLGLIGYFALGKAWQTRWELQYRNSTYRDEDVLDIATNNSYTRKENRYRLKAGLIYNVSDNLQVTMDYTHTRNDSNRVDLAGTDLSDYQQNLVGASLVWYY
jgi:tetratricopeptide (TPR) repeat protein